MKLRITQLIPFILILVTIFSGVLMFHFAVKSEKEVIRQNTETQLALDISRLQNILYNLLTEGNGITNARLNISMIAMDPIFEGLILADENNTILIANRYSWEGDKADSVTDYDIRIAESLKSTNKPKVFYKKGSDTTLYGYYPVILKIETNESLPIKKTGVLFTEISLADKMAAAEVSALNQAYFYGVLMLLTAAAIGLMLHYRISKRLMKLRDAAASLSAGELNVNVDVGGHDELRQVADVFNEMAATLRSNIESLQHAEKSLIEMNNTLEERVEERTNQLKDAQRIAHIGNWQWNIKTNELIWSDEVYRIFGFEVSSFIPNLDSFLNCIHPDDTDLVLGAIDDALKRNGRYSVDHRIVMPDESVRWVHEEGYISRHNASDSGVMNGIVQEITERVNETEQLNLLEKQLQQAQKMESIGQLTGGIAHDFNNMLASIKGFTELTIQLTGNSSATVKRYLEQVLVASNKATELVAQLMAFSRSEEGAEHREQVSLPVLVNESISMLRPMLPSSIELQVTAQESVPHIEANTTMLSQIVMNLCVNAKDAMSNSLGKIEIYVRSVTIEACYCASCYKAVSGDYVELGVSDNGAGISVQDIERIFEPFYTTKTVGKGTGMGLSMVHGLVHKNNGHILVESSPGQGTTFRMLFPCYEENVAPKRDVDLTDDVVTSVKQNKSILVVDDETSITFFLKELLESEGYSVTTMNSSAEALEYFKLNWDAFDLLITDYTMPEMTGVELAQSAMAINTGLPVIICTGFSEYINVNIARDLNFVGFLQKPLDRHEFLKTINECLSEEREIKIS